MVEKFKEVVGDSDGVDAIIDERFILSFLFFLQSETYFHFQE
jgi:hypothetical protein